MTIEDLLRAQPAALPDSIVIAGALETTMQPSEDLLSADAPGEEAMPPPSAQPLWPRVFPGL